MASQSSSQGQLTSKPQRNLLTPSLFVPPLRNASTTSLQLTPSQASQVSNVPHQQQQQPQRVPLQKQRSNLGDRPRTADPSSAPDGYTSSTTASPSTPNVNSPSLRIARTIGKDFRRAKNTSLSTPLSPIQDTQGLPWHHTSTHESRAGGVGQEHEYTEAVWSEMQSTLEEVELGAANGPSVFHRDHSRALEELRKAQIALAEAWAKSEITADESNHVSSTIDLDGAKQFDLEVTDALAGDRMDKIGIGSSANEASKEKSTKGHIFSRTGMGGQDASQRSKLDEETERDIQMSRKRRQANDRYFEKVNKGVMDVVAKLEIVAKEMGAVERESQEIWGDHDSIESGSDG